MDYVGVIDLGTNTFHLLIARLTTTGVEELYRKRIFVRLAENGIATIGEQAYQRALDALLQYKKTLDQHLIRTVRAFGTAALRTASNGQMLTQAIYDSTGIEIDIISGHHEAQLIYEGVQLAVPFDQSMSMIMDIGGGSVEFIIANKDGVIWAHSYPIGVAVLFNQFHQNDPITPVEIQNIRSFLQNQLFDLQDVLQKHPVHRLIGASGTFDVLEKILPIRSQTPIHSVLERSAYAMFYDSIIGSTYESRLAMPQLPANRAQLIVVAAILIDVVLQLAPIQQIDVSAYAMKEGILAQLSLSNK